MDFGNPMRALCAGVEADVLLVLARSHLPLSGERVAALAQRSPTQVRAVLERLEVHGLVRSEPHGRATEHLLNREHLLAGAIEAASDALRTLEAAISEEIDRWEIPPVVAAIFGSAARGSGDEASDVDLLLVRRDDVAIDDGTWAEQRYRLARQIEAWTGNPAQIVELASAELRQAVEMQAPLVESLRAEPPAVVHGRLSLRGRSA